MGYVVTSSEKSVWFAKIGAIYLILCVLGIEKKCSNKRAIAAALASIYALRTALIYFKTGKFELFIHNLQLKATPSERIVQIKTNNRTKRLFTLSLVENLEPGLFSVIINVCTLWYCLIMWKTNIEENVDRVKRKCPIEPRKVQQR